MFELVSSKLVANQRFLWWWTASEWEAVGVWVTVVVAMIAAGIALIQISAARKLRAEEAQPYVAIYMDPSAASSAFIDIVIRNFGNTAATDVKIVCDAPLQRSNHVGGGRRQNVWLPEAIPTLVPAQEWRTLWDFGPERYKSELATRHVVTVEYQSSDGRQHKYNYVLDWAAYLERYSVNLKTVHHAAKSLEDISKTIKNWNESVHGSLSVYVRDGVARDRELEEG